MSLLCTHMEGLGRKAITYPCTPSGGLCLKKAQTYLYRKPAPLLAVSIAVVLQLRAWPLLWILAMANGDLALALGWRFCHAPENAMPFPTVTDSASLWPLGYPSPTFSFRFSSSAQLRFLLEATTGTGTQRMLRKYIQKANVSVVEKNISLFLIESKDNIFRLKKNPMYQKPHAFKYWWKKGDGNLVLDFSRVVSLNHSPTKVHRLFKQTISVLVWRKNRLGSEDKNQYMKESNWQRGRLRPHHLQQSSKQGQVTTNR